MIIFKLKIYNYECALVHLAVLWDCKRSIGCVDCPSEQIVKFVRELIHVKS